MTMKDTKQQTILVVDDEKDLADITAETLIDEGFSVVTACDGEEALKILHSGQPIHMIFSDIRMPKMDGVALLKQVKIEFPSLPVCMVSGCSAESEKEVLSYGAVGYLSKPYSFDALVDIAHQHLSAEPSNLRPVSAAAPLVYVVEDEAIDQDLLRKAFAQVEPPTNIELEFFFDGEAFFNALAANQTSPDLIILDINLPGISGLDALEKAKSAKFIGHSTSVIVLSSSKLKKDRDRAAQLGVDSYYAKPMERASWWHLARAIHQSWILCKKDNSKAA